MKDELPSLPKSGEDLTKTVFSERWWAQVFSYIGDKYSRRALSSVQSYSSAAINNAHRRAGLREEAVLFKPCSDATGLAIVSLPARRLFSAFGEEELTRREPNLRATLRRASSILYTTAEYPTNDEGRFYGYPIGNSPVEVKIDEASTKPWLVGMPCGRKREDSLLAPEEGGLILVGKPTDDGYAYVIADEVRIWEGYVIIEDAGTDVVTTGTGLAYKQTVPFGLLKPKEDGTGTALDEDIKTDWRGKLTLRETDEADNLADGVRIGVQYVRGHWRLVWAGCAPVTELEGETVLIEVEAPPPPP